MVMRCAWRGERSLMHSFEAAYTTAHQLRAILEPTRACTQILGRMDAISVTAAAAAEHWIAVLSCYDLCTVSAPPQHNAPHDKGKQRHGVDDCEPA